MADAFIRAYYTLAALWALFVVGVVIYAASQGFYAPLLITVVMSALASPWFVATYRLNR